MLRPWRNGLVALAMMAATAGGADDVRADTTLTTSENQLLLFGRDLNGSWQNYGGDSFWHSIDQVFLISLDHMSTWIKASSLNVINTECFPSTSDCNGAYFIRHSYTVPETDLRVVHDIHLVDLAHPEYQARGAINQTLYIRNFGFDDFGLSVELRDHSDLDINLGLETPRDYDLSS